MSALYAQAERQAAQLEQCGRERASLVVTVGKLRTQLRESRERLELWELRRQAWTRERAELLRRLDGQVPHP
jgi:hypothetical protein